MSSPTIIPLTEYRPRRLPASQLSIALGQQLYADYGSQVGVAFPNPATDDQWQLTAQGWVGHIPLSPELHLALEPKVPLRSLFGMLEVAYRLELGLMKELVTCQSLAEFYERLATVLARRVLDRARRGLHRAYIPHVERLPYVRGRLDVDQAIRTPGRVRRRYRFEEQTADIDDNRLLAYTLWRIARSGRVLPAVQRAVRLLRGEISLQPFTAFDCLNRRYHRLNEDYRPLHALCRFFLAHLGPGHQRGERQMLPFLIEMSRLYELFVAEWLAAYLADNPALGLKLTAQEAVNVKSVTAQIDIVLADLAGGQTHYVLDTKYKVPDKPANEDIYQVVAYAEIKQCTEAVLVYPAPLRQPLDTFWGDIRVRSLTFALDGNLDQAGQGLIDQLLEIG